MTTSTHGAASRTLQIQMLSEAHNAQNTQALTGWRHSASYAPALVENILRLRAEIAQEYAIRDIIVLGMGGSALGTRVFADAFSAELAHLGVRLRIIDTSEPSAVTAALNDFNIGAGLIIVSSKSGGTIEPLCLGQIFFDRLSEILGSKRAAAAHFIAISDADTPLSNLAKLQGWRGIINSPSNIGGRFSALTAFGLAPIVLAGINPMRMIEAAQEIQFQCTGGSACPAEQFALSIYQNMYSGHDKLIIGYVDQAESFARWLEQLIAESLGKQGKGLIPLPMPLHRANKMLAYGKPDVQNIALTQMSQEDFARNMVLWMFAIEKLAGYLQVNPFDQPNVEMVKQATRTALAANSDLARLRQERDLDSEEDDEVFEGDYLEQMFNDSRVMDASKMPDLVGANSYIALLTWAPVTEQNKLMLENLAGNFQQFYQRPVVIAEGPGYLHASGQLYKGGPNSGVFAILSQNLTDDLTISGTDYSLKQLYRASLAGDIESLLTQGRRVVKL